jgi:hypothetical protein
MDLLDTILIACLGIATAITLFMTVARLATHHRYLSYDCWIFAMCFAITLQVYDSHFPPM